MGQIVEEIKFVVVHARWQHQGAGPAARLVQLLRMLVRDESISLPMDEEGWTSDLFDHVDVAESFADHESAELAANRFHHTTNRSEG